MTHPLQHNNRYVGELLVKEGVITSEELETGLLEQRKNREFLCATFVRLGFASEEKIFSLLSLQIGIPFMKLNDMAPDPLVLARFPGRLALALKCMPIAMMQDALYVAMSDPLNGTAVSEIKSYLGAAKIKVFLCGDCDLREAIRTRYGI